MKKQLDAIDYGYDATSFDNLPNDIYSQLTVEINHSGWGILM
jgi:hypothetical protein